MHYILRPEMNSLQESDVSSAALQLSPNEVWRRKKRPLGILGSGDCTLMDHSERCRSAERRLRHVPVLTAYEVLHRGLVFG